LANKRIHYRTQANAFNARFPAWRHGIDNIAVQSVLGCNCRNTPISQFMQMQCALGVCREYRFSLFCGA